MFDNTCLGARRAISSVSDLLADQQPPMPTPNVSNKSPAKKAPEKIDLAQKLSKRRSQEFAAKIATWNTTGGGVLSGQTQDEVVVIVADKKKVKKIDVIDPPPAIVEVVPDDVEATSKSESDDGHSDTEGPASPLKSKSPAAHLQAPDNVVTSRRVSREVDLERKAWVRRKSKQQVVEVEPEPDIKHAGTPKKRVISDGHWRRDRSAKPEAPEQEPSPKPVAPKLVTPKPVIIRHSVASVGLKIPPSVQDYVEEFESRPMRVRPLRKSRSRSRSRSRGPVDDGERVPDYASRGLKVYVKRRQASRPLEDEARARDLRSSESSLTTSSVDRPTTSTGYNQPAASPVKASPARPSTAPKERALRPSPTADHSSPRQEYSRVTRDADDKLNTTSHRKSSTPIRKDEKRVSPKSEPKSAPPPLQPGAPRVFGTRIEGWLATTSDPFAGPSASVDPPAVPRHRSGRYHDDKENEDVLRSEKDDRLPLSEPPRRSRPSVEPLDDHGPHLRHTSRRSSREEDVSSPTTPTLLRRGARRTANSPTKERSSREDISHSDDLLNLKRRPVTDNSQADLKPPPRFVPRKPLPRGGRELSTIASVETFNSLAETIDQANFQDGSVLSRASDGDERRHPVSLKRRLTKHSDLISVLSAPRGEKGPIRSARSIRSQRLKGNATIGDIMNEVTTDELKYQRELRTLVDGVIPVLLQCVLSGSGSATATAAGLFGREAKDEHATTKPIVDMGIALERLKTTHKRIPMHRSDDLLDWAQSASKVYVDYLKAWRLGFQDVVVNLAPAEESEKQSAPRWDDGLPRNQNGDLLSGDGERVDVAYLLKRPLVRLKHLAKTFETIHQMAPSRLADNMAVEYNRLVQEARTRANEETARLEDEAASAIDPSRARDPRSLAPITGVHVDHTRCVRARDYFDLDLRHSTGQQLTCKVEIVLRDDAPVRGDAGDVLFCEVSTTGRWLLFPPVLSKLVSARRGDQDGEIIVMIRGFLPSGREWREVLSLQAEDEQAVDEWLGMLSSTPVPSSLTKRSSFDLRRNPVMSGALPEPSSQRMPSLREVEVPIGEPVTNSSILWDGSEVNSQIGDPMPRTVRKTGPTRRNSQPPPPLDDRSSKARGEDSARTTPRRYRERPRSEYLDARAASDVTRTTSDWTAETGSTFSKDSYSVWLPSSGRRSDDSSEGEDDRSPPRRPAMRRRTSSVPSRDLPTAPTSRKPSQPTRPKTPEQRMSGHRHGEAATVNRSSGPEPASAPAKLQKLKSTPPKERELARPPQPPAHNRPTSLGLRSSVLPSFTPAFLKRHRRSSSPLKHEYEPSTASSGSDSDLSALDDGDSFTSDSATEGPPEDQISTVGELKSFPVMGGYRPMTQRTPPESVFSPTDPSLAPSQSASQAPYRTVPLSQAKASETVACIFAWSESGSWESLHPEECCIVVTPGLIEAFDIAQAHAAPADNEGQALRSPSTRGVKPLVALELTPLVPLRRGTALDISIRSPPTANSLYRTGNNIMFRSRNTEECETLYHLINRARIDNPTYIALQRARGPQPQSNWGETMDRRNAQRPSSGSWWNLGSRKSSTYRSNSSARPQSIAVTDSSVASMNTAFSALRRFSGSGRFFNIARSTITSRQGSRSTYSDSLDSGVASPVVAVDPALGTPLGLTNMKIRLYFRETASKWRDLGSARLTILIPPRADPSLPGSPAATGNEKRVLVTGKTQGQVLLDATLGESAFERIARTGIAVSVWEEHAGGHVAAAGGVLASTSKVYMIQMRSVSLALECGHTSECACG